MARRPTHRRSHRGGDTPTSARPDAPKTMRRTFSRTWDDGQAGERRCRLPRRGTGAQEPCGLAEAPQVRPRSCVFWGRPKPDLTLKKRKTEFPQSVHRARKPGFAAFVPPNAHGCRVLGAGTFGRAHRPQRLGTTQQAKPSCLDSDSHCHGCTDMLPQVKDPSWVSAPLLGARRCSMSPSFDTQKS